MCWCDIVFKSGANRLGQGLEGTFISWRSGCSHSALCAWACSGFSDYKNGLT